MCLNDPQRKLSHGDVFGVSQTVPTAQSPFFPCQEWLSSVVLVFRPPTLTPFALRLEMAALSSSFRLLFLIFASPPSPFPTQFFVHPQLVFRSFYNLLYTFAVCCVSLFFRFAHPCLLYPFVLPFLSFSLSFQTWLSDPVGLFLFFFLQPLFP